MIHGIGIDIVKIERIRKAVEARGGKFLQRVFTGNEIAYCYGRKDPYPSLSARFAAKEAFVKAIGSAGPFSLADIEVVNDISGKPSLKVYGKLEIFLRDNLLTEAHLSLSHEKDYAVACVVIEKKHFAAD